MAERPRKPTPAEPDLESTATLLLQIREGDAAARDRLIRRFLPKFQRWARGRTPANIRHLAETDDLVQDSLIAAMKHVEKFDAQRSGAFFAYLIQILRNRVRDYLRQAGRRPPGDSLPADAEGSIASPLEQAIGAEKWQRYLDALEALPETRRIAVVLRIEMGLSYREIADAIESPSSNAARMTVTRAIEQMAEVMDEH